MMLEQRIRFDDAGEVLSVDFSDLRFESSAQVDEIYDEITEAIERTGRKWFFVVDYGNSRVDLQARLTWEHRGKKLNEAWSLGSVRFQASGETRDALTRRGGGNPYYANLAESRDEALALVAHMRAQRLEQQAREQALAERAAEARAWEARAQSGDLPPSLFGERVEFDAGTETMEADFSDFDFVNDRVVDAFYDYLETCLGETGRRWYFLVNLRGCTVRPEAWFQYARRGKALNLAWSKGSVRYDATPSTAAEIERRANTEAFDPNLFDNRQAAVARIARMRAAH